MDLKAIYDSVDDIPETVEFRDLFTEKNGKLELTGISGLKTDGDVTRLQTSLHKAQEDNKGLKTTLKQWDGLDISEVQAKLDRLPELEAAAKGKLDDAAIDEIVNRRVEGTLNTKLAPLQRELKTATKERDEYLGERDKLLVRDHTRQREDALRPLLVDAKVLPEHHEDVFLYAERHLERTEDGKFVARDGIPGVTPGSMPKDWLSDMLERRPGWLPGSVGGGARGSGSGGGFAKNPWTAEHWNLTDQGQFLSVHGTEKAHQAAKAAGSSVGSTRPPVKK